jgi:hypothetical protein
MKKSELGALTVIAAMVMVLLGIGNASADSLPRSHDSSCLEADRRTYILCEALLTQPAYDYTNADGSVVGVPSGGALVADLAEQGITATRTPAVFRDEALVLTTEHYMHEYGSVREDGSPCTDAATVDAYIPCAALWEQPSYDRNDGSGLSAPEGSEMIAEMSEAGVTPRENPRAFAAEATSEAMAYWETMQR